MPKAAHSPSASDPTSAALHEMTELLTALAGYTGAARRLLKGGTAESGSQLAEILDKIASQERQARKILLRLRRLLPADPPEKKAPGHPT